MRLIALKNYKYTTYKWNATTTGEGREIWRENVKEYCNSKSWLNDRYNDMRQYGNCKCATMWNEKKSHIVIKQNWSLNMVSYWLSLSPIHAHHVAKSFGSYSLPRLFHRLMRITHKYKQKCCIDAMILIQIDKIWWRLISQALKWKWKRKIRDMKQQNRHRRDPVAQKKT